MRWLICCLLFVGCALKTTGISYSRTGPGEVSVLIKYIGGGCPDYAVWDWGGNEGYSVQQIPDCGRDYVKNFHKFKAIYPRRVKVEFYQQRRIVAIDYLYIAP